MRKVVLILLYITFVFTCCSPQKQEITMTKEGGIYTIPCELNGIPMNFIYDTGASYVSISSTEAEFLYKQGLLKDSDFKGISYSQIANGDIIPNAIIILDSIKIGSMALYSIEARVIYNSEAPLLLGQSALERLGRIEWEGNTLYIAKINENPSAISKLWNAIKKVWENEHWITAIITYIISTIFIGIFLMLLHALIFFPKAVMDDLKRMKHEEKVKYKILMSLFYVLIIILFWISLSSSLILNILEIFANGGILEDIINFIRNINKNINDIL